MLHGPCLCNTLVSKHLPFTLRIVVLTLLVARVTPRRLAPPATTYTDPRFDPLIDYMKSRGSKIGPITLSKSISGDGNGAFLTSDVEKGDVIFTVPKDVCIGVYTACGDEEIGEYLAEVVTRGQGGATCAVATFIAKEWLCNRETGIYGAYLSMLPWDAKWPPGGNQEQDHVLWWTDKELDQLEGDESYEDALDLCEEVKVAERVCKDAIGDTVRDKYKEDPDKNLLAQITADRDIERAVRGAFVSILTRAFLIDSGDEENRLVPLLDMLQHESSGPNVRYDLETDEETGKDIYYVKALKPLAAGTELVLQYDAGEWAERPGKFLSRMGFVPGTTIQNFITTIKKPPLIDFGPLDFRKWESVVEFQKKINKNKKKK